MLDEISHEETLCLSTFSNCDVLKSNQLFFTLIFLVAKIRNAVLVFQESKIRHERLHQLLWGISRETLAAQMSEFIRDVVVDMNAHLMR